MPTATLKSLADKADKSLKTVEKYWKEAMESAKKKKDLRGKPEQYAMGIVKKRLGLEDIDLVLMGFPVPSLIEADVQVQVKESESKLDRWEKTFCTLLLIEFYKVSKFGQKSRLVEKDLGSFTKSAQKALEEATVGDSGGKSFRTWIDDVFPGVPDIYKEHILAILTKV